MMFKNSELIVKEILSIRKKYDFTNYGNEKIKKHLSVSGLYLMRYDEKQLGSLIDKYGNTTKYLKIGKANGKEGLYQRIFLNHYRSSGVLHNTWLMRDEILMDLLREIDGYKYDFRILIDRQRFIRKYCYFNVKRLKNVSEIDLRKMENSFENKLYNNIRYIGQRRGKPSKKYHYQMK